MVTVGSLGSKNLEPASFLSTQNNKKRRVSTRRFLLGSETTGSAGGGIP